MDCSAGPVSTHGRSVVTGVGHPAPEPPLRCRSPSYETQRQPAPQPLKATASSRWPRGEAIAGDAKIESSRVVSEWPSGQLIGARASDIGLRASKRVSQTRHRYS